MIVVCTDISPRGSIKGHQGLTLNKKYEVILHDALYFEIINDDGFKCSYRRYKGRIVLKINQIQAMT